MSDVRNLFRFEVLQSVFNILQPGLGFEAIPMAAVQGVAVVPYSPLASGLLTGKHRRSGPASDTKFGSRDDLRGGVLKQRYWDDQRFDAVDKLKAIAEQSGEPMVRLALQWVSEFPGVTAPIFGARRVDQVEDVLEAWSSKASPDVMLEVGKVADDLAAALPMKYPPAAAGALVSRAASTG